MIDLGDLYPLTITIRDADGNPADATEVVLTVTLPDGTDDAPAVEHPDTGRYQVDYPTVQAGRHVARWVATGTNAAAYVEAFDVREASPALLVSLADAKRHLHMDLTATSNDEELRSFIEAATGVVEDVVGPVVVRTVSEVHRSGSLLALGHCPVVSLTSLVPVLAGGIGYAVDDVDLDPETGIVLRLDGGSFAGPLRVTYQAGRRVVPASIAQGGKEVIRHMWETQRGHSGARPGFGDEEFMQTGSGFTIPRRVYELLAPHRRAPLIA